MVPGCASLRPNECERFQRRIALPVETTAAIVAGALRHATGRDDPRAWTTGAPAQRLAKDHFRVHYGLADDGSWVPLASHGLRIADGTNEPYALPAVALTRMPAARCTSDRGDGTEPIRIDVRGDGDGTAVTGVLPPELRPALERALTLATDPGAPRSGLEEPNLAAHVAWLLAGRMTTAEAEGDREAVFAFRQRIADLGHGRPGLLMQLGDRESARGDDDGARSRYWQAVAGTDDAMQRAVLARRLSALRTRSAAADAWRTAARSALAADDLAAAALLLHRARRLGDAPAADYRLLGELHRRRREPMAAFANDLLAREHAGVAAVDQALAGHPAQPAAERTDVDATSVRVHTVAPAFAVPPR